MELRARKQAEPHLEAVAPDDRSDPAVRRRMSGPAIRTFFNVALAWDLSAAEQRALLGWPAESTFFKYKAGHISALPFDMLMRISLVLGIYKDLHILYPEPELADRWVKLPNSNPLFGGKSALTLMMDGGMDGLYQVRRLLDGRRAESRGKRSAISPQSDHGSQVDAIGVFSATRSAFSFESDHCIGRLKTVIVIS